MQFPCFIYCGNQLYANLVTLNEGAEIRCYIRNTCHPITPEEQVRQSLIWFLLYGSKRASLWCDSFSIRVEQSDIDVSLLIWSQLEGFYVPFYFLIIETKAISRDYDPSDLDQIRKYVLRKKCRNSLWFNGAHAIYIHLPLVEDEVSFQVLSDMSEFDYLIDTLLDQCCRFVLKQDEIFNNAQKGDFNSFIQLTEMYGDRYTITFEYTRDDVLTQSRGFLFRFNGFDCTSFKLRGVSSKRKRNIYREDFRRIVSITEGAW